MLQKTVPEVGWDSLPDDKLLAKAQNTYDVFATSDRNLYYQQSVEKLEIHILLLVAVTNVYEDLLPLVKNLTSIIRNYQPGQFSEVS